MGVGNAVRRTKMMGWGLMERHGWALHICKTDQTGFMMVDEGE